MSHDATRRGNRIAVATVAIAAVAVALVVLSGMAAAAHGGGHAGPDTHVVCPAGVHDHHHPGTDSGGGHTHTASTADTSSGSDGHNHEGSGGSNAIDQRSKCEYHSIQNAVNASDAGDTVYLQPGRYHQHVEVTNTSNLTIAGAGRDEAILVGPKAHTAHDHSDDESGSGDSSYQTNPFADPIGYFQAVIAYPEEWASDHAERPYEKTRMHYHQGEEFAGVDGPALPENPNNGSEDHHVPSYDGISVTTDNVTVRDLEVRQFAGNGVYYSDVRGFHVARVDAVDNGAYGIYAIRSNYGAFVDSYAEGHYDSGFYLGQVQNCQCVMRNVTAVENLIGYSGTGASFITIKHSTFRDNAAGVVPNVLPQEPKVQTNLRVVDNWIVNNNNRTAFRNWHFAGSLHAPVGTGVVIGGGSFNTIAHNHLENHSYAAVAITYMFTEPNSNAVVDNHFEANDLEVWWDGGGAYNCFARNTVDDEDGDLEYDAGAYWNTRGSLPGCAVQTNAGAPDPKQLAEIGSIVVFGCPLSDQPTGEACHVEEPEPHYHPPSGTESTATSATPGLDRVETLFGGQAADALRARLTT